MASKHSAGAVTGAGRRGGERRERGEAENDENDEENEENEKERGGFGGFGGRLQRTEFFQVVVVDLRAGGLAVAVGETVSLLHPPLAGVSTGVRRKRQQNDSTLADGHLVVDAMLAMWRAASILKSEHCLAIGETVILLTLSLHPY